MSLRARDTAEDVVAGGSAYTLVGDVKFDDSIGAAPMTLLVNGTITGGANVFLGEIHNCPSTATLQYNLDSSAALAVQNGFILFKYNGLTYNNVRSFTCQVRVCGTDGCVSVVNPNVAANVATRRLLAAQTGSASFEPNQMSVSGGDGSAADPNGRTTGNLDGSVNLNGATHTSASVGVVALMAVAVAAMARHM